MHWMDSPDSWDEEFFMHYEEKGASSIEEAYQMRNKEIESIEGDFYE